MLIKERQKLILIADSDKLGWKTSEEYETNELASDEEDEKRLWKASQRVDKRHREEMREKVRKRPRSAPPSATPMPLQMMSPPPLLGQGYTRRGASQRDKSRDICMGCGKAGHWRNECPLQSQQSGVNPNTKLSIKLHDQIDKASPSVLPLDLSTRVNPLEPTVNFPEHQVTTTVSSNTGSHESNSYEILVDEGESVDVEPECSCPLSPVGKLQSSISFWQEITQSDMILNIIQSGYKIPLSGNPPPIHLSNNRSAIEKAEFVSQEVQALLTKGCISVSLHKPTVVNPLTVSKQKSGKLRLILDL